MKITRALLSALALLALLVVPALAQTGNVTVELECYLDPEGVIVTNDTDAVITVTGVTSSSEPDGDPERDLDVTVGAGETVRIDIGAEAAGSDNIFDNELNESATVYTSVGNVMPSCEEAAGIGVGLDDGDEVTTTEDDQDDQQDDQQDDGKDTVTKTFELTLNGDVPEDRGFAVFYGTRDQFERSTFEEPLFGYILFCGQPEDVEFADTIVSEDDCVGGGNTYTADVELPQGTELYFSFVTAVETDLQNTADFFHGNAASFFESGEITEEPEVLSTDFTNTAWYTFGGGAADDQQDDTQDDQQGEMPEELPETGVGGLAAGATIPLSGLFAAYTMLIGAGYIALRRR